MKNLLPHPEKMLPAAVDLAQETVQNRDREVVTVSMMVLAVNAVANIMEIRSAENDDT